MKEQPTETLMALAKRKNKKIVCLDIFTGQKESAEIIKIQMGKITLKFPNCKYLDLNEFSDVEYTGKQLKFN